MKISREKQAISAYLKLLQSKGASTNVLYKRSVFLDLFTPLLHNKTPERFNYRMALDEIIKKIPPEEVQESLNIAREFYSFWVKDIKAIATFNANYGFDVASIQWKPLPTTLNAIIQSLDKLHLNAQESQALNSYNQALIDLKLHAEQINAQLTLAKIILLRLQGAPANNHKCYRIAVDLTLPLFALEESKDFFLKIVREFYPFWIAQQSQP